MASTSGSARSASYDPIGRGIPHSAAYPRALSIVRLATISREWRSADCRTGMSARLMRAVPRSPHRSRVMRAALEVRPQLEPLFAVVPDVRPQGDVFQQVDRGVRPQSEPYPQPEYSAPAR